MLAKYTLLLLIEIEVQYADLFLLIKKILNISSNQEI